MQARTTAQVPSGNVCPNCGDSDLIMKFEFKPGTTRKNIDIMVGKGVEALRRSAVSEHQVCYRCGYGQDKEISLTDALMLGYTSEVSKAWDSLDAKLRKVAKRAFEEVVQPWCDRHTLKFKQHTGHWDISGADGQQVESDHNGEALPDSPEGTQEVLDVLYLELPDRSCLFEFMPETYDPTKVKSGPVGPRR